MAKGKVTEQEIYVMKGMYSDGMKISDIAEELSRSPKTIEKYLDSVEEQEHKTNEYRDKKNTTMFIKKTSSQKRKGITIMTDAESARSDEAAKRNRNRIGSSKTKNAIHKISE